MCLLLVVGATTIPAARPRDLGDHPQLYPNRERIDFETLVTSLPRSSR